MGLKIIGAGFGRTGTESMKRALDMIGFGPCYHMLEVLGRPKRSQTWVDIAHGRQKPDWDAVFEGYQATVDWPAAYFWKEIASHFPEAKILLTVRSVDSWYNSMDTTILKVLRPAEDPETVGHAVVKHAQFQNDLSRENVIRTFEAHYDDVRRSVSSERLLVYELGSGWEPLCAFLGCDVPDAPFPRGNDAEEFHRNMERIGSPRGSEDAG